MRRRIRIALACCAALAAGACGEAEGVEVQPLPPLQRPSPEARAGLPEVRGVWRFAGFEIPARDTAAVRERVYTLVPPGEFRLATQRLDSIAGQYVREGVAFPFTGEVRRDSTVALVAFSEGVGQFVAGRVVRDTLWIELTSFSTAQTWPTGTRAALVRGAVRAPFRRLLGGVPIAAPVDSAAVRDSIRLDSLRRAGMVVTPGAQPLPGQTVPGQGVPGQVVPNPPVTQPGVRPTVPGAQPVPQQQRPPAQVQPQQRPPVQTQPQQRPPVQTQPRPQQPRPQPQRPPVQQPQPTVTQPVDEPPPSQPAPSPSAPRDTIRFGSPP
ncbi:hypothetical protein [Longimicrobium sp.]|uniref:hypothetical protein n=1 Tax=Longimicrobium sp. TaxID=2029185 RepID=UPI002E352847|nr:hypothetical protein [Longimicrobium sp.]HEX6040619.1 hypothetical protein [Longimicrobium sp.]